MIDKEAFDGCTNLTIHGVAGSTAQRFAEAMDIPFVAEDYPGSFQDVNGDRFYGVPVLWAAENGITTGYTDNTFRPNRTCTRAEMVTFLWRLEYCPEPSTTETKFTDLRKGSFYEKAVLWAAENGIVNGVSETSFAPMRPSNAVKWWRCSIVWTRNPSMILPLVLHSRMWTRKRTADGSIMTPCAGLHRTTL